ncbi:MAG: putative maltokinase [Terriglobales bacterium]
MPAAREIARALAGPTSLPAMLPDFLRAQRWFGGKARPVRAVSLVDAIPFAMAETTAFIFLARVEYREGAAEIYSVPMVEVADVTMLPRSVTGESAPHLLVMAEGASLVLYDALRNPAFLEVLLAAMREGRRLRGEHGELRASNTPALEKLAAGQELAPKLMRAEQSNTSVVYGDKLVFKLFRRVAEGVNPDIEIGRFLTEKTDFRNVPLLAGALEYVSDLGACSSLGMLQSFVRNQGDAWEFTLGAVGRYLANAKANEAPAIPSRSLLELGAEAIPDQAREVIGEFIGSAELLGRRTAELHLALATHAADPAFDPEEYSAGDQRSFCESALDLLGRNLRLLERQMNSLPREIQAQGQALLQRAPELERRLRQFEERPIGALRTRVHGDYHLGQVLVVEGRDFVLIDFEGEPARSLEERRRKRSPLQDVAGMLRSFHYAAFAPLLVIGPESLPLETYAPWATFWQTWVSAAYLREYFSVAESAAFLPRDGAETAALLNVHLLEKAIYELGYELNNRPSWVRVPLSGIEQLLGARDKGQGARQRIA